MTQHQHQLILLALANTDLDFFDILDMSDEKLEKLISNESCEL